MSSGAMESLATRAYRILSTQGAVAPASKRWLSQSHRRNSRERTGLAWTEAENETIRRMRNDGQTFREIAAAMPDRSLPGLMQHVYRRIRSSITNIRKPNNFTQAEIELLTKLRAKGTPWNEVSRYFPDRTKMALQSRLAKLNNPKSESSGMSWSPKEDELLLHCRRDLRLSWFEIQDRFVERSVSAIKFRYMMIDPASQPMGISSRNMQARDIERAQQLRSEGMTWAQVAAAMSNEWTASSCYDRSRASERFAGGIPSRSYWKKADDTRLLLLSELPDPWKDAEAIFGRTIRACQSRLRALKDMRLKPGYKPTKSVDKSRADHELEAKIKLGT